MSPDPRDGDPLRAPDPDPLPVAGHQGCARWWLLWLAVGAAFWAIVLALILANRAAPTAPSEGPDASVTVKGYTDVPVLRGAPQNVVHHGSEEASSNRGSAGGTSPATESGAPQSLPVVAARPQPSRARESAPVTLRGFATWCGPTPKRCQGWGEDVLIGGVNSFRWGDEPYTVRVRYGERSVRVRVISFCACGDRHGLPTLIDLSPYAMSKLDPNYRKLGILRVTVEGLPR